MMHRDRPLVRLLAAGLAFGLTAAACSSDGGGGDAADTDEPSAGGATARGVTDDTVTIGFSHIAVIDAGIADFDRGDIPLQWESIVEGWRARGLLPVHGRDVELVFREYDVIDPAEIEASQRAACVGLVEDEEVFAVLAEGRFQSGGLCVADELETPLLAADGAEETVLDEVPIYFTMGMSFDRELRSYVRWADENDLLDGKTIGLVYQSQHEDLMNRSLKPELEELGYSLAAEAGTSGAFSGPEDEVVVQQFIDADVDLVLLLGSTFGFAGVAEEQGYRPEYISTGFSGLINELAARNMPPGQYGGSLGVTVSRADQGVPISPEVQQCFDDYEATTGERLDPAATTFLEVNLRQECHMGEVLIRALEAAGPDLTPESFVAALETLVGVEGAQFAPITFGPGKHDGVDGVRTIEWDADCPCWNAVPPLEYQPVGD